MLNLKAPHPGLSMAALLPPEGNSQQAPGLLSKGPTGSLELQCFHVLHLELNLDPPALEAWMRLKLDLARATSAALFGGRRASGPIGQDNR